MIIRFVDNISWKRKYWCRKTGVWSFEWFSQLQDVNLYNHWQKRYNKSILFVIILRMLWEEHYLSWWRAGIAWVHRSMSSCLRCFGNGKNSQNRLFRGMRPFRFRRHRQRAFPKWQDGWSCRWCSRLRTGNVWGLVSVQSGLRWRNKAPAGEDDS